MFVMHADDDDERLPSAGKLRLSKWFTTMSQKNKAKTVQHLTQIVLSRKRRGCNIIEYKGKDISFTLHFPAFLRPF